MPSPIFRQLPIALALAVTLAGAQSGPLSPGNLSQQEMEQFLRQARVLRSRVLSTGITGSRRLTLSDGNFTHDAHLQTIDEYKPRFESAAGTEINFRDSYKYNIAAYRLNKLLNLNMIPVSIERRIGGQTGSVTWWVDNVLMMEKERYQKKIAPPDLNHWNDQMYQVRVFNELVYNVDPNLGNLLITTDWRLWMIDFSRAFRLSNSLRRPENLVRIDRRFYEGLRRLDEQTLIREMQGCLTRAEIRGLLRRRDKILEFFDREIAAKGEAAVVCDRPGH